MTSRRLAGEGFTAQLKKIVDGGVNGVILREKDLDETEYERLAREAQRICSAAGVPLYLHSYAGAAERLKIGRLHLPLAKLLQMEAEEKKRFQEIGASVHSLREAVQAEAAGAAYVTAGHVFWTDCKKGLAPRGLSFLEEICSTVRIPVYAIGGITPETAWDCLAAGAAGVCLMSSLMQAEDPGSILEEIAKYRSFRRQSCGLPRD